MKSNSKSSQSRSATSYGSYRTTSSSGGGSSRGSSKLDPTGMYKRPQQQQVSKCHYLDPTGLY